MIKVNRGIVGVLLHPPPLPPSLRYLPSVANALPFRKYALTIPGLNAIALSQSSMALS